MNTLPHGKDLKAVFADFKQALHDIRHPIVPDHKAEEEKKRFDSLYWKKK